MNIRRIALLTGVALSPYAAMPIGAYDANDPADKKILDDAVEAALEAERETHAAEVTRITDKNKDLLKKIARLREGGDAADTGEIARLEADLETARTELNTANSKLRTAERDLKAVTTERDTFKASAETERTFSETQLKENALNSALATAKVAPHFMDAAKALLSKSLTVEMDGDNRIVKADGKDVSEFVTTWASGDAGKHMIAAPGNAGGSAHTGNAGTPGAKPLKDMTEAERREMAQANPDGFKALVAAEQPQQFVTAQ